MLRHRKNDHTICRSVYEILRDSGITDTDTLLQIQVDDELLAENSVILDLWTEYQSWIYVQSDLQHYIRDDQELPGGYIFSEWQYFIARNGENLRRMLIALYSDYNPIENYSMTESGADGERRDKSTTTPSGKTTSTVKTNKTGINSTGTGALTDQAVDELTYENAKTELSFTNTQSMSFDGSTLTGYHTAKEHYFKRSGNIGTTTTADMITGEKKLREETDLIRTFVQRFMYEYCYYVGGDE